MDHARFGRRSFQRVVTKCVQRVAAPAQHSPIHPRHTRKIGPTADTDNPGHVVTARWVRHKRRVTASKLVLSVVTPASQPSCVMHHYADVTEANTDLPYSAHRYRSRHSERGSNLHIHKIVAAPAHNPTTHCHTTEMQSLQATGQLHNTLRHNVCRTCGREVVA